MMYKLKTSAIMAAHKSDNTYKHGCSIGIGGRVITEAFNGQTSFCHAEINAIIKMCRKIPRNKRKKCKLLILRINSDGKIMNSKPCAFCCELIRDSGIKNIMYSDDNQNIIKIKSTEIDNHHISKGLKIIKDQFQKIVRDKFRKIKHQIR